MNQLLICALLLPFVFSTSSVSSAISEQAVVHAVLFYSPNCSHCHHVINEVLPPLFEQYGDQLYVMGVDITQPDGQALFMVTIQHFKLESSGVPFLVVGETFLVGSVDIPERFPGLIEQYLAQGGVDFPDIPGLAAAMEAAQITEASPPAEVAVTDVAPTGIVSPDSDSLQSGGLRAKFAQDLLGNSLAILVLLGMVFVLGASFLSFWRAARKGIMKKAQKQSWPWLAPVLCVVGLGVAGYLAFVEMTRVQAVCGPVGDCNTVQQSEYAMLFGILPIGLLGMAGYVMILIAWAVTRLADRRLAAYAALAQLGMTAFGVLFSIYLTCLEPFVIGATCAWCLTSAVIMTALLWLSLAPARPALSFLLHGEKHAFERSDSQHAF